jgi:glycosyltransferase involved in cell wall biosynthesis
MIDPPEPHSAELLSIVVPVFNEARTVRAVVDRLRSVDFSIPREIIIVNDGSTDGTEAALRPLAGESGIAVVNAVQNRGKGSAIRLGLSRAQGTILAIQDADLELDPAELTRLVGPILAGKTSVVYGSRFLAGRPNAPWTTIAANLALTWITNRLYGSSLTDMETCYKIMRTEVARSLELESDRFDIEPEITAKLLRRGHQVMEVAVRFEARPRSAGKKIRWRDGLRALWVLVECRFARP